MIHDIQSLIIVIRLSLYFLSHIAAYTGFVPRTVIPKGCVSQHTRQKPNKYPEVMWKRNLGLCCSIVAGFLTMIRCIVNSLQ